MQVIIMRGHSGSGKSTFVKKNFPDAFVVSADKYFESEDGYTFDPKKIGEAHKQCLRQFVHAVTDPLATIGQVVVDNTNMQIWEIAPYIKVAQAFGHDVEVHKLKAQSSFVAAQRNVHECDEAIIRRQLGNYQSLPRGLKSGVKTNSHKT